MGADCHIEVSPAAGGAIRRALWWVIAINAAMFLVEGMGGWFAASASLHADALDFAGDTATYGLSLFVLARPPRWRATAALIKGVVMASMGVWVLGMTAYRVLVLGVPDAAMMGAIGGLAFAANLASVLILLRFRGGDANMRSVWLCSRNDMFGNLAVILAASGVFASGAGWPDLVVATVMALLFVSGAAQVLRQATGELKALRLSLAE